MTRPPHTRSTGRKPDASSARDEEAAVEALVERDLDLMEPGYLEERSAAAENLRQFLYNAAVTVVATRHRHKVKSQPLREEEARYEKDTRSARERTEATRPTSGMSNR